MVYAAIHIIDESLKGCSIKQTIGLHPGMKGIAHTSLHTSNYNWWRLHRSYSCVHLARVFSAKRHSKYETSKPKLSAWGTNQ